MGFHPVDPRCHVGEVVRSQLVRQRLHFGSRGRCPARPLVVIDTAPREAGGAAEAARLADLVLIPCRPSAVDLAAIPATLAAIGMADAVAVLNACPPRGPWVAEAVEAVRGFGLGRAPVTLGARIAHARAFTLGRTAQETEPASPVAREIADLYRWAMKWR